VPGRPEEVTHRAGHIRKAYVRNRRIHRRAAGRAAADRGAEAAGVPRLRLRGVAVVKNGTLQVRKEAGKIAELEKLLGGGPGGRRLRHRAHPLGDARRAHAAQRAPARQPRRATSRWCTTASSRTPTRCAAAPGAGHTFTSETDTEVLVHLIEEVYDARDGRAGESLERAVEAALAQVEGTYGIAVVSTRDPEKIVVARLGSPLLIGVGENGETFVASDAAAVIAHTRDVVYLDDGDMATITRAATPCTAAAGPGGSAGEPRRLGPRRGGARRLPHFMLKEIMEQPETLRETMRGRLLEEEGTVKLGGLTGMDDELREIERVIILGCGTSWHSGLIGEYMLEDIARIPTEVEYASEFRYRRPVVEPNTWRSPSRSPARRRTRSGRCARRSSRAPPCWASSTRSARPSRARPTPGLPARGAGDRRGVDQGVHLAGGGAGDAHGAPRAAARDADASRGREIVRALGRMPEQVAEILEMDRPSGSSPRSTRTTRTSSTSGAATTSRPRWRGRSSSRRSPTSTPRATRPRR
jgi:glutamine---fructose-6-phosphate transaminase (isomerizing)